MSKKNEVSMTQALAERSRQDSLYIKEGSVFLRDLAGDGLNGLSKTYVPVKDDGLQLDPQNKMVSLAAPSILRDFKDVAETAWDAHAVVDFGNAVIKADIVVDDVKVKDVPVPYLLYLEKELKTVIGVLRDAKVLDPQKEWSPSRDSSEQYRSNSETTTRNVRATDYKILTPNEVIDGQKFEAKVVKVDSDVVEGTWTTQHLSGAMSATEKRQVLDRAEKLLAAVVYAREEANGLKVDKKNVARTMLDWLFQPVTGA